MNKEEATLPLEEDVFEALERAIAIDILVEKMKDAMTPGYQVAFDPEEAERAGAFIEDALSEEDALESAIDLMDALELDDKQE